MTFRYSATDIGATDIGPVYDVGLATRDGSKITCLDRNLRPVAVDRVAYMLSRYVRSGQIRWASSFAQAFKESTELQEKSKLVQLGTSNAIDREFDQWVQNTQGDWSGGIGQRVYGQQGRLDQYFDGEGLQWPLNDWIPQMGLRGPVQGLPSPGVTGPSGADAGTETVTPGGALTVKQMASILLSLKASGGTPTLVGALGAFTTGSNVAVAPPFGQATTQHHTLVAVVDGQRQSLSASANLGETAAATSSFDFSGVNTDNVIGTANTFTVPAGGIYANSISCYMGGHTAACNTIFAIWNASTGALIVYSSTFSAGKGRSLKTQSITQTFIPAGTVIRVGFWRQQNQDAEWGVASSGTFNLHANTGSVLNPTTACSGAYVCGHIQAYVTYQQLSVSDIVQSNAGPAPGWTKRVEKNSPDGYHQIQAWVNDDCAAGAVAPTFAAAAGGSPMHARLMEWSNVALASSTDQTGTGSNSNLAALTTTNASQDTVAADLVIFGSRISLSGAGTAAFTESFNNGATTVDFGDSGSSATTTHHASYSYTVIPTGLANFAAWANTGTAGGFIDGLGHGYALAYLDDQVTPHWHATFFSGDAGFDVDLGANTNSKQGPLHMHIAGGYLWILFSEYPNTNQVSVRMLGCLYGSNTFAQLRNDLITPAVAGSSGFVGLIAAAEVGGKAYVAFLQADADAPPGSPSANRNALYVLDYSLGTGVAPTGTAAAAFPFPFLRGFKLVDLCWQGNQLVVSVSDGSNAYIYELSPPFSTITSRSVIPGIANGLLCAVGSTVFINGWTPGPAGVGINRMDLYLLDGGTLTEIPFSPLVPFLDSVTSPQAFGGYAMWAVSYPTPGAADPNQKTITVYAYDVVRSRLFRALTTTDPSWTSSDLFAHDEIALFGVTARTQAAGATFQSQLGMAVFSGVISGAAPESAREFYWGVRPITPTPPFDGLLQMGVNIVSGLFDFTAATNKLFRAVLSHFINGLQAGASSPSVTLNVWFDQDPNRLSAAPDFTLSTGQAPNPLPAQLDLNLFTNRVARKLVYQVISENGSGFNGSAGWQNAPKVNDVIVQAATGWVYDMVFDISPSVVTNTGAPQDYAYQKQSDPSSNDEIDAVVAYNFLRKLWREKGGECTIYLPNGESFSALIQLLEFESPKPAATVSRSDKQMEYQIMAAAKIREDT